MFNNVLFLFYGFLTSIIGSVLSNLFAYVAIRIGANVNKTIRIATYITAAFMTLSILLLSFMITSLFGLANWMGVVLFFLILGTQYLVHPYLVLRGEYIRKPVGEEIKLVKMLEELKRERGVRKKIDVFVAESDIPNAFAVGNVFKKAIVVNKGLIEKLGDEQIRAVLAHELGHIVNRDNTYALASSLVPYIAYIIGLVSAILGLVVIQASASLYRSDEEWAGILGVVLFLGGAFILVFGVLLVILSYVVNVTILAFSRLREHLADMYAVGTLRNTQIAKALVTLENSIRQLKTGESGLRRSRPSLKKMLYIVPTLSDINTYVESPSIFNILKWFTIFSTHPPTKARVFVVYRYYREVVSRVVETAI